ncbi:hypothetical protein AVEN_118765-1 [Araneus ventricosus]|uniref:Uncharacterized protein n=1 Tax=Araneus ventricosus TaxID=182803 RepID=A0A4Y2BXM4_ARAVE|nr:hypothetical protein AVEN_118765-1 [Araneus ventricosus]
MKPSLKMCLNIQRADEIIMKLFERYAPSPSKRNASVLEEVTFSLHSRHFKTDQESSISSEGGFRIVICKWLIQMGSEMLRLIQNSEAVCWEMAIVLFFTYK